MSAALGKGTSTAGLPAAASSATVLAPLRQRIRSASANLVGISSRNAATFQREASAPLAAYACLHSNGLTSARSGAESVNSGTNSNSPRRNLRHHLIEDTRSLAPAKHKQVRQKASPIIGILACTLAQAQSQKTPAAPEFPSHALAKISLALLKIHRRRAKPTSPPTGSPVPAPHSAQTPASVPQQNRRHHRRSRSITAHPNHHIGPEAPQQPRHTHHAKRKISHRPQLASTSSHSSTAPLGSAPAETQPPEPASSQAREPSLQTAPLAPYASRSSRAIASAGITCPPSRHLQSKPAIVSGFRRLANLALLPSPI